ncbi:MAG: O-antigen ligase family protein [Acidobacteria bacterium]|nr:O-antigen ligase family protein [Acidobacteriota bacterium]
MSPSGYESFRLPKEMLFRAFGLLALALFTTPAVAPLVRDAVRRLGREALVPATLLLWAVVSMLRSAHRAAALESVATLFVATALFIAFLVVSRRSSLALVYWTFLPATANIILYLLQRIAGWSPFRVPTDDPHLASTAFLGNPNDVGMLLLLPVLAAFTLIRVDPDPRRHRLAIAFAIFGTIGLVASESMGAIGAFVIGLWLLFVLRRRSLRTAVGMTLALLLVGAVTILAVPRFRIRGHFVLKAARQHRFNAVLSGRLEPILAAGEMTRAHPVTGVGPGTFRSEYFEAKLAVDRKYRTLMPERMEVWQQERMLSFSEAHDEYAQIAAELGLPGLALFLIILVLLARRSFRPAASGGRAGFSRDFALPAVAAFAISILVQFPLRVAAPLTFVLFFAAACAAWNAREEPA